MGRWLLSFGDAVSAIGTRGPNLFGPVFPVGPFLPSRTDAIWLRSVINKGVGRLFKNRGRSMSLQNADKRGGNDHVQQRNLT